MSHSVLSLPLRDAAILPRLDAHGQLRMLYSTPPPGPSPAQAKLLRAAQDFEAILIIQILKAAEGSFSTLTGEEESSSANGTYKDWGLGAIAGAMARSGGLGLAQLLVRQLNPELQETGPIPPTAPPSQNPQR